MPEQIPLPAGTIGTEPGLFAPRVEKDKDKDPGPATTGTAGSDGAVPPMPSEVTNVHARRTAADGWLHRAMMPLRAMMRRASRQP
jgi:hypothetical protein